MACIYVPDSCCANSVLQVTQTRYAVNPSDRRSSGSFSQLLTGNQSGSMVFVPYKQQSNQVIANSLPGSSAALYSAANSQQAGAAVAPEPYQILMPVQMADGRMLQMPPEQAKVSYCEYKATHAWNLQVLLNMQRACFDNLLSTMHAMY